MSRLTIHYSGTVSTLEIRPGETVLAALQRAGIPVFAPCGGRGHCRKCVVQLREEGGAAREVLACQTALRGGCEVEVPVHTGGAIAREGCTPEQGAWLCRPGLGAAVDLGTTTVVVQLFSLEEGGERLGTAADWNVQAAYGGDVISRVQYVMTHEDGLEELSTAVRRQIFGMAEELCARSGRSLSELKEVSLAGNTIMQHIFAGIDPSSIAVAPYQPSTLFLEEKTWSFPECPGAEVSFSPCVAGYVGGDITAGLLSAGLLRRQGVSLFLDIGTNGEMALCDSGSFSCCSVASGPAFEGGEISCGMPSNPGAVSHVKWADGDLRLEVIGGGRPAGLCGSGLIDLLALLLEQGGVDETGRLLSPEEAPEELLPFLTEDEDGNGLFHVAPGVAFTAGDVRKLQLAKAAVAAGIEILLNEAGKPAREVEKLYLAGGFGGNLSARSAAVIGMFPPELEEKIVCVGNSSLAGAGLLLQDPGRREEVLEIRRRCRYLELSGSREFSDAFVDHMSFESAEEE